LEKTVCRPDARDGGSVAAVWYCLCRNRFFGTAKVKPTVYTNFDFDDDKNDKGIINEGGITKGEHVRAELRLGWAAKGDNWSVKMIAEGDVIMEKDTADRSYYIGAEKKDSPNTGGEFGIERVELLYTFLPQLELQTGWDIRAMDIQTGGLLYGDDHPFLGFRGKLAEKTKYEVLYIPIQNNTYAPNNATEALNESNDGDWRVYTAKLSQTFGGEGMNLTFSPMYVYSDNQDKDAKVNYYGLEVVGSTGPLKPYFEILAADGEFNNDGPDISSWAMYAGVELPVNKAFNPYVAYRYTQGDDDSTDDDVEGWVGVTDIGRFTGLMGMDGNILGEDMGQVYGATLYSYSPERAKSTNRYGGIGNGGSGDNPGQSLIAIGTKGDLAGIIDNLSYKTQVFFIWYDATDNLVNVKNPGDDVDDYAGTTFDLQLKYELSKNFAVDYIFSTFIPGDGIQDQVDADDNAYTNCLTLAWTY